ncbi:MAG: Maf family protein [Patescibacteria group bacterium]
MIIKTEIILASGSRNRRMVLESLGIPFRVVPSNIGEEKIHESDPIKKVQKIARLKAQAVATQHKGLIIAADTFGLFDDREFQKPASIAIAREMLQAMSGKTGQFLTGICIINTERLRETTTFRAVTVRCKKLTYEEIENYIRKRPVTDWAAAYNPLDKLSSSIFKPLGDHAYRIEYHGLPLDVLAEELKSVGIKIDLSKFKKA